MEQLEYWQAIEDGAEVEEEPKKKKKTGKKAVLFLRLKKQPLPKAKARKMQP